MEEDELELHIESQIREQVIEMYGGRCIICLSAANHIHHIDYRSTDSEKITDLDNMVPLCNSCHAKVHRQGSSEEWKIYLRGRAKFIKNIFEKEGFE